MKPLTQAVVTVLAILFVLMTLTWAFGQHPASCQVMKPMGKGWRVGSAGLISPELVVTNHHVAGSSGPVKVAWPSGREAKGQVVGSDRVTDVAVVKLLERIEDLTHFTVYDGYPQPNKIGYQDGAPHGKKWYTRKVRILGYQPSAGSIVPVRWYPHSISGDSGGPIYGQHKDSRAAIYALCAETTGRTSLGPSGRAVCQVLRRLFGNGCIQGRFFRPP